MDPAETIEKGGFTAKIHYDEFASNPRKEFDNAGTMVCWHSRYDLGDEHKFSDPTEALEHIKETGALVFPLFLYDHSGLRIKIGGFGGLLPQGHAEFDTMQVGWIFIEPDKVKEEWGEGDDAQKRATACLEQEVETYDQYLSGQVYGITIEDDEGVEHYSCWGFFGFSYAKQEAEDELDACIKRVNENCLGAGI